MSNQILLNAGESRPVAKKPGSEVVGGSVNGGSSIVIQVSIQTEYRSIDIARCRSWFSWLSFDCQGIDVRMRLGQCHRQRWLTITRFLISTIYSDCQKAQPQASYMNCLWLLNSITIQCTEGRVESVLHYHIVSLQDSLVLVRGLRTS